MGDDTELELRRKRLLYRSIYRGNKENDILLGQFARAHIAEFTAAELDQYERLLAIGDNDIIEGFNPLCNFIGKICLGGRIKFCIHAEPPVCLP